VSSNLKTFESAKKKLCCLLLRREVKSKDICVSKEKVYFLLLRFEVKSKDTGVSKDKFMFLGFGRDKVGLLVTGCTTILRDQRKPVFRIRIDLAFLDPVP
jgi:hypothetical protein